MKMKESQTTNNDVNKDLHTQLIDILHVFLPDTISDHLYHSVLSSLMIMSFGIFDISNV